MLDWLTAAARARPDHHAVEADGRAITYAELDERAAARAPVAGRRRAWAAGTAWRSRIRPGWRSPSCCTRCRGWGRRSSPGPRPTRRRLRLPDALAARRPNCVTEMDADAVHSVIRTSGTTGEAKAVELTFANHAASAAASAGALGVDPADRWLCPLPLHHVGGLAVLVRCAINHTTAVLHDGFDVSAGEGRARGRRASPWPRSSPRCSSGCARPACAARPGLRAIALGGGPIPAGLLEWAADTGIPVVPVYGMTETCSQVVAGSPGRPLPGVELRIAGDGEILVRGPMVAAGAWPPTAGCTPATSGGSTTTACCTWRAASRT